MIFVLIAHRLQTAHPLVCDSLAPVNLAHSLLHLCEVGRELFPVCLLVHEYLFCCGYSHCCEYVDTLRHVSQCGLIVIVHHLLKHLCIRHIALRHHTDLVVTGLLVFRTDTCLLVAYLFEVCLQFTHGLLVIQQFFHWLTCFLHFGNDLRDAQIVVITQEVCDDAVKSIVFLLDTGVVHHRIGDNHSCVDLIVIIHSERHALQPHHTSEVFLEGVAAGIVSARTEETVCKRNFLVVSHKVTFIVLCILNILYLLCYQFVIAWIVVHVTEQAVGNGEEPHVVLCCTFDGTAFFCMLVYLPHRLLHLITEL